MKLKTANFFSKKEAYYQTTFDILKIENWHPPVVHPPEDGFLCQSRALFLFINYQLKPLTTFLKFLYLALYGVSLDSSWPREISFFVFDPARSLWGWFGGSNWLLKNCINYLRQLMQFRFNYLFQSGYISVTRPPIEILSPLFTLQLLILPTRDPF